MITSPIAIGVERAEVSAVLITAISGSGGMTGGIKFEPAVPSVVGELFSSVPSIPKVVPTGGVPATVAVLTTVPDIRAASNSAVNVTVIVSSGSSKPEMPFKRPADASPSNATLTPGAVPVFATAGVNTGRPIMPPVESPPADGSYAVPKIVSRSSSSVGLVIAKLPVFSIVIEKSWVKVPSALRADCTPDVFVTVSSGVGQV